MPSKSNAPLEELNREGKRIQELIARIAEVPDPSSRQMLEDCLESLLRFYGQGLARILDLIEEAGPDGREVYDRLINDGAVRGLLLIHGLHPVALETRLREALDKIRPYMESHGGNVELLSLEDDVARLRLQGHCKTCPSSAVTMELAIRGAIEEACPDLMGFEVEGIEQVTASAPMLHVPNGAPSWTEIAEAKNLGEGAMIFVHPADFALIICKHNSQFYAYRDHCPACNMPLHLGAFENGVLIVDARNESAVVRLRSRKHREEKPFALMAPSLDAIEVACSVSELEERLLLSPESPIVLLERRASAGRLAASIAPGNPSLGVMLPYTPLHHLLLRELGFEIVATSGNLSDEPICTDENEAVERLRGIADGFLVHDRPIVRHVDDSVVRVMRDRELVLRRARGYAPLPVHLKDPLPCVLAVGAHLKNSVALSVGTEVFISQHIGDLATNQAFQAFRRVSEDLLQLYAATPAVIACDMHPEYLSTKYARQLAAPTHPVQHHWAHVLSCMAENEVEPPALGVSWDGTGYGTDGTIWGGEFLLARGGSFERVARFRQFRLPGGEAAIRQPSRTALGVLFEIWDESAFGRRDVPSVRDFLAAEIRVIRRMLVRGLNAPVTSSAGRLFDAVASLIGLRHRVSFEGQAAMELEFAVQLGINASYPFEIHDGSPLIVDWGSAIEGIVGDVASGRPAGEISAKFHNTLAEIVRVVALRVGEAKLVLTGGCFQNRHLTEACLKRLLDAGFRPYWHQRVPPNDGGISLGQVVAAAGALRPRALENQLAAA